jgi:hypothetical protein
MATARVRRLRAKLQKNMTDVGARLDSLSQTQNVDRIRNNNIEGEDNHPTGESIIMAETTTTSRKSVAPSADNDVAPAGGHSDTEVVRDFAALLRRPGSRIVVREEPNYTRQFLETAIPTAVVVSGIVVGTAAIIAIDNKWGHGKRVDRLIDRGAFDNMGVKDAMAIMNPGAGDNG